VRILVVSDTHIPDFAKALPGVLVPALKQADLILHAGDVTSPAILDQLAGYATVRAVIGNGDPVETMLAWGASPTLELTVEGVRIGMIHDAGPREGRERRMRRRFPDARAVVFGHSHIPWNADVDGQLLFNPGSPTWKRRQPAPTYGLLHVSGGQVRAEVIALPAGAGSS
jgi:uncharacterized protein